MSDFFRRYIEEVLEDQEFIERHPHLHVRLVPVEALESVDIGELEGAELQEYDKASAAVLRGDPVPRLVVDVVDGGVFLAEGAPVLQAARDEGIAELWARIRYESRDVDGVWWTQSAQSELPLDSLLTEDGDELTTESDVALVVYVAP